MSNHVEKIAAMNPRSPNDDGLVHFYSVVHPSVLIKGVPKKSWKFLNSQEYAERKHELPDICFATRHPIEGITRLLRDEKPKQEKRKVKIKI